MSETKPTIYIETTIPNFFFDFKNQSAEKKVDTVFFWNNNLKDFQPVISLAVVRELSATPDSKWKERLVRFVSDIKTLEVNQGVVALAEKYVKARLIPRNYSADAVHLAVATAHKVDYLLTWNIQHLAHPTKRKMLREYNVLQGLYVTEIVTPKELNYQIDQS